MNLRLDRGLTQTDLATRCGLSPAALCRIERGGRNVLGTNLFRIARVLGVACDYLLDDQEPYPPAPGRPWRETVRDPSKKVRTTVSPAEKLLLEALRSSRRTRDLLQALPTSHPELLALVHRIVMTGTRIPVAKVKRLTTTRRR